MEIVVNHAEARVPVTIFRVKGKIDTTTYEQLEQQAREAHQAGMQNLILDLSDVPYVSSAGLRALHRIFLLLKTDAPSEREERMRQAILDGTFKSPHLKLAKPSANVLEALKLVGYDMYIDVHPSVKDALAAF